MTLNSEDWTPANYIPQDCVIDFVSRWQEQSPQPREERPEEDLKNEFTIFVDFFDQTRVWKLTKSFEWSSFRSRVDEIADVIKWNAVFGGAIWEDDSRTPEKNTTVTVNLDLPGGEPPRNIPSTHVWVRIDDREPFQLGLLRGNEWNHFQRCVSMLLKKWPWTTFLRGQPWINDERKPMENDEIQISIASLRPPAPATVQALRR
jgi:hypothetical protein